MCACIQVICSYVNYYTYVLTFIDFIELSNIHVRVFTTIFTEWRKITVVSWVYNLIDLADELHASINSNFCTDY